MERGSKVTCNIKWKQEAAVFQTNKKLSLNNYLLRKGDWNKHLMLLGQTGWAAGGRHSEESLLHRSSQVLSPCQAQVHLTRAPCCQSQGLTRAKPGLFRLSLLQEWVLTASIRTSASQAIQESNFSLLPWAGYYERQSKIGIWTTGHLQDVFPVGVYRGIWGW